MADTDTDDRSITYEDAIKAIGARLWKLAPPVYVEAGHKDLVFHVTMQDLLAAVRDGFADAAEGSQEVPV